MFQDIVKFNLGIVCNTCGFCEEGHIHLGDWNNDNFDNVNEHCLFKNSGFDN